MGQLRDQLIGGERSSLFDFLTEGAGIHAFSEGWPGANFPSCRLDIAQEKYRTTGTTPHKTVAISGGSRLRPPDRPINSIASHRARTMAIAARTAGQEIAGSPA